MKPAIAALALGFATLAIPAHGEEASKLADAFLAETFAKASPEWLARMKVDATIESCNRFRNNPPAREAEAIVNREQARIELPGDGVFLGDWKAGYKVANDGRGGQFSDPPGTVNGGNCYACHQMDPVELSYGTLGPSLKAYGRERGYDPIEARSAYAKIYNSQSVVACSSMPRFGSSKVLSPQQIKDLVAYLFDPASPVNK